MTAKAPLDEGGFAIAIICALKHEVEAVYAVMDKFWDDDGYRYRSVKTDPNSYTTGVISQHNVVLVHMVDAGTARATYAAAALHSSFPNIELALVVGICGGMPIDSETKQNIFLGDLIISTALVQYGLGRQYPGGFLKKDTLQSTLGAPSPRIGNLLSKCATSRYRNRMEDEIAAHIKKAAKVDVPDARSDVLFDADFAHKHRFRRGDRDGCNVCEATNDRICQKAIKSSCEDLGCLRYSAIVRVGSDKHRVTFSPQIYFGSIGSGDIVMKSGRHRDHIAQQHSLIAFEMEGAGVWDVVPTIVIKGVCDYADSHKNNDWQRYAAAVAAGGAKALLKEWQMQDVDSLSAGSMAGLSLGGRISPGRVSPGRISPAQPPKRPSSTSYHIIFVDQLGRGCSRVAEAYTKIVREWSRRTNTPFHVNRIHAAGIQNSARSTTVNMQRMLDMQLVQAVEPPLPIAQQALFESMGMRFQFKDDIQKEVSHEVSRGLDQSLFAKYDFVVTFEADVRADLIKLRDHMTRVRGQPPPPDKGKIVMLGEYGDRKFHQIETPHRKGENDEGYKKRWRGTAIVIKQSIHAFLEQETGWIKPPAGALEKAMANEVPSTSTRT